MMKELKKDLGIMTVVSALAIVLRFLIWMY